MTTSMPQDDIIKFIRRRDYRFVKELGQGACGKTVLLRDDQIDEQFVCKKFTPYCEEAREELFGNFIREIKILHNVFHNNIVRVFNHYLYPEQYTGYILMEFIDGLDVGKYLATYPERINEVFLQTISGFRYLEAHNILHRDIRLANLLIRDDGTVKIIDFGFGKQVQESKDFDKSVSLNWWCELPDEFANHLYDFRTEVYFVGKLFERIIQENAIDQFKYKMLLGKMCEYAPENRIQRFEEVENTIQKNMFFEIGFEEEEIDSYRNFADALETHITKLDTKTKYQEDVERVQTVLENAYRSFMLERTVPDSAMVLRCLINGVYYYKKKNFPVYVVRNFLHLLKSSSVEKKRIILSNLHTRLNAVTRYSETKDLEDSIPF